MTADEWAARIASELPPLTSDEIAAVGQLAAALDARSFVEEAADAS